MKKKGLLAIIGLVALGIPTTVCAESFTTGIYTYSVNPDGVTVTLTKIEKQRYEQPSLTYLDQPAVNQQTGKSYIITALGDGTNQIADETFMSIIIPDNILRVNDNAVYGYGTFTGHLNKTTVSQTNNLEYIGDGFNSSVEELYINTACEIGATESFISYMQFGDKCPKILTNEGAFNSIGTIRCTTATPPDINAPLLTTAPYYARTILIVPDGAKEAYKAHDEWGKFVNIRTESEHKKIEEEFNVRNFYTTNTAGDKMYHFVINDDLETVTLVTGMSNAAPALDLAQPVTNPADDKSYTITYLGNGLQAVSYLTEPVITPNILGIRDNAQLKDVTTTNNNTSLRYIGLNAISSVKNVLYIPDGCTVAGELTCDPYYIRIGKNVELGSKAATYISAMKSGGTVRIEDPVPPTVDADGFLSEEAQAQNAMLFVPRGSLQAYRSNEFWGKFGNIYEFDKPAVVDADYSMLEATDETFTVTVDDDKNPTGPYTITCAVNRDGKSVTIQKVPDDMPPLALTVPSKVSNKGKEYDVKVLAFNLYNSSCIKVPASVVRITGNTNAYMYEVANPNGLMYISRGAFSTSVMMNDGLFTGDFTINDGCTFISLSTVFKDLTIGNIEVMGNGNNVFGYFGSPDEPNNKAKTISMTTAMPPVILGQMYPNSTYYQSTTVTVPKGSIDAYRNAREWKRFNLVEDTNSAIDTMAPDAESAMTVITGAGELTISVGEATTATVYDLAGRAVKRLELQQGENRVALQSGLYIIAAEGQQPVKAMVK